MSTVVLPRTRALVLSRWRVLYVVTPKVMCTSLLWAVADLQGEPLDGVARSRTAEVTRALAVHDPEVWRRTRSLHDLAAEEVARITGDERWFRFCLTRHPVDRLWSAWQSKLLLREPAYAARFGARSWFPRLPASADAVTEDFARFVDALERHPRLLTADQHWAPQAHLLRPADFPYTAIGRVEESAAILRRLTDHLEGQGWTGRLRLGRRNASLLPRGGFLRDAELLRRIEQLYADDMTAFGYTAATPGDHPAGAVDVALPALAELADRHERIGDLHRLLPAVGHVPPLRAEGAGRASGSRPAGDRASRRTAEPHRPRVSLVLLAGREVAHLALPDEVELLVVAAATWPSGLPATRSGRIVRTAARGAAARFQAGLDAATGELVVLCRDVVGLTPGWVQRVRTALRDDATGLVGALVRPVGELRAGFAGLEFVDQVLNCRWRQAPRGTAPGDGVEVPLLSSTFLAARRMALSTLGGLDTGMRGDCWHDVELSLRARRAGLSCRVLPDVVATWRPPGPEEGTGEFLHDLLRLAFVHLDRPRLDGLVDALRGVPHLSPALAEVLVSDVGHRREQMARVSVRDVASLLSPSAEAPARDVAS